MSEKKTKEDKKEPNSPVFPEEMQDKTITTTTKNLSTVIKEKLQHLKDLATMEILLPSDVRMKHRLQTIKELGSAKNIKVRGHWKTTPPTMYITGLEGRKINNEECQITFKIFEVDKEGNKKLHTHHAEVTLHDGSTIKRATSAEYRISHEVKEIIKTGKPIVREVIKIDTIKEE